MESAQAKEILEQVAAGTLDVDAALAQLKTQSTINLGFAQIDLDRQLRQGVSEVVYGAGKTAEQIIAICSAMVEAGQERVLITRMDAEKAACVGDALELVYDAVSGVGRVGDNPKPEGVGTIVVAAAGTSDLYAAEEAALTAEFLGNKVQRLYDVGVAGIHRLLSKAHDIAAASCIVAVAGMEGALPSVIAGLASCPVIAVPTSVGYGASFGGIAALLAMLNSCSSGVSVVNIDNGFGAGYQASMINHVGL